MKVKLIFALIVLALSTCGPARIKKLPVPRENVLLSFRLMAEGDKLLVEDKDHLALLKYFEAARLNPYYEVIFNKLAIAYSHVQQFQQGEQAVRRSIGLNPDYPFAYNTRGIIYLAYQENKRAIRSFKKAINLRPREANFYLNLGHTYLREDDYKRGLSAYQRALELDPEILNKADVIDLPSESSRGPDPERLYQTARIFAELGYKEACLDYLGRALSAGFSDKRRLMDDTVFQKFHQDSEFLRLMSLYGIEIGNSSVS
ncbi:tetratricopeptide repeat protein, partial [Acidobacteria bacterium AH-259-A15]|nr:tetratricopeptide repeat protein [Acidobacteria bacterium AH-259-A15]